MEIRHHGHRHRRGGLPGDALAGGFAHRVAVAQRVLERLLQLGGNGGMVDEGLLLHQRQEDVGQADAARTFGHAGVAGHAAQHAVGFEDLLDPSTPQHVNDSAGRVIHILAIRAGAGAGPALDAGEDAFAFRGSQEGFEGCALLFHFGFEDADHDGSFCCAVKPRAPGTNSAAANSLRVARAPVCGGFRG